MAFNTVESQTLVDDYKTLTIKVTGVASGAWSTNAVLVKANSYNFANASLPANILTLVNCQYSSDVQRGGYVQLNWHSTVNANVAVFNFGQSDDGIFSGTLTNNANTPDGDMGIQVANLAIGDTFNFILTFYKENQGLPGNVIHYGAGAWANGYADSFSGQPY